MGIGSSVAPMMCTSCAEGVCCSGILVFEDDEGDSNNTSVYAGVRERGGSDG